MDVAPQISQLLYLAVPDCTWFYLAVPWYASYHHRMFLNAQTYKWMDGIKLDGNLVC